MFHDLLGSSDERYWKNKKKRLYDEVYNLKIPRYYELDIRKIRLGVNMVLVRIPRKATRQIEITSEGISITATTKYRETRWAPTYVEVARAPDKLSFDNFRDDRVTLDLWSGGYGILSPGTRCIVRYVPVCEALGIAGSGGQVRAFVFEGEIYITVNVKDFILAIESDYVPFVEGRSLYAGINKKVRMLNDWVLISPVQRDYDETLGTNNKHSGTYGIIKHIGERVSWYREPSFPVDTDQLKVGDLVAFKHGGDINLQHDMNEVFGEKLFRCNRRHIIAREDV